MAANATFALVVPPKVGSWYGLVNIYREAAALKRDSDTRVPVACPRDGTLLVANRFGQIHCPSDGWEPGATDPEWVN